MIWYGDLTQHCVFIYEYWRRRDKRWRSMFRWFCRSWSCTQWHRWYLHANHVKRRITESRGRQRTVRACVHWTRPTRPSQRPHYRTVHSAVQPMSSVLASTSRIHALVIFTTTAPRSPYLTHPARSTR